MKPTPKIIKSKRTGEEMQKITITIPAALFKRVDVKAEKLGCSRVEVIKKALDESLPKLAGGQKRK